MELIKKIILLLRNVVLGYILLFTLLIKGIVKTTVDICHALGPDKELRQKGRQALKESCIQFGKDFVLGLKQGWYNVFGKR